MKNYLKGLIATLAMVLACSTASAQFSLFSNGKTIRANGNYVTKEYRVGNFSKLVLACPADVKYTQKSGNPTVKVYVSDNIAEVMNVKVSGSTLTIGIKKGYRISNGNRDFTIELSSASLDDIDISGSGTVSFDHLNTATMNVQVTGSGDILGNSITTGGSLTASIGGSGSITLKQMQSSDLTVRVTGSGDMNISGIKTGNVEAKIAGSGGIKLKGTGADAVYSVTGSGDLIAKDLQTANTEAKVTGSGDITCYASKYLKAEVTGSGDISYAGNPAKTDLPHSKVHAID